MIATLHPKTNNMIKMQNIQKPTTKPKFKQKQKTHGENELIKEFSSYLLKEINNNPCKKPHHLIMDIFNQLIDCLLKHEEIINTFSCLQEEQLNENLRSVEDDITKKYLLINIIKRINFKLDEKYNHAIASENTRKRIKHLLADKFSGDQKLAEYYNNKFEEILRSKCML